MGEGREPSSDTVMTEALRSISPDTLSDVRRFPRQLALPADLNVLLSIIAWPERDSYSRLTIANNIRTTSVCYLTRTTSRHVVRRPRL
jgi:hypothetical protein